MSEEPGARPAAANWTRFSAAAPIGHRLPTDQVVYGALLPDEAELRLLGSVAGQRVLDLGCGAGRASVAFARQGAKVMAVDSDADQLAAAREAADRAEVRIELHHADPADLAFLRADGIDVAFSAFALAEVADLDRVFRQVHRVLKPEHPLVFSLPHPAFVALDPASRSPLRVRRAYDDPTPVTWSRGGREVVDQPRTIGATFTRLIRSNFRVDTVLEPMATPPAADDGPADHLWADAMRFVPAAVIFRARKLGI